ncbi:MAG: hypothetical protein DSY60_02695 [Persephonella sp.]|nr:MAG: hypothetical protein DSY60_02695 [Persephonella sp.]
MNTTEAILLLIISIGAFLIPFISKRLMLPSAVGEIIFGLILGIFYKDYLSSEQSSHIVKFLGELGFIILMYLAGLELNFDKLKKLSKRELGIYVLTIASIIGLSFSIVFKFNQPVVYALVYLTVGVGLLFSVLKETKLLKTTIGQTLLILASIGEIVSLFAITFFSVFSKYGLSKEGIIHTIEIYLFFSFVYIIIKLFKLFVWWYPEKVAKILGRETETSEIGLRANFMIMFIFVSLASLLKLEAIIGAFIGGMMVSLFLKDKEHIEKSLSSIGYGFLIPIFFIEVGLSFDLFELLQLEILKKAFLLTVIIFIIRILSSVLLLFAKLNIRELILVPLGLSIPLTLLVAIATIGLHINLLSKEDASAIILTAVFTGLIYPWFFKMLVKYLNIKEEKNV